MMRLSALLVSAGVNLGLSALFWTLYLLFRKQRFSRCIYFPKRVLGRTGVPTQPSPIAWQRPSLDETVRSTTRERWTRANSFAPSIAWIFTAWRESEEEMLATEGVDAVVLLRLIKLSLKIFLVCGAIGLGVLMPVNISEGLPGAHEGAPVDSKFEALTIGNIRPQSKKLWVHAIATYMVSFATCYLLFQEYARMASMRLKFLRVGRWDPSLFAVLVRRVPISSEENVNDTIARYFLKQHPFTYHSHRVVYRAKEIEKLMKQRQDILKTIKEVQSRISQDPLSRRPAHKKGFLKLGGERIDTWEHYNELLAAIDRQITLKQSEIVQDPASVLPTAFVIFKSRWGSTIAAQTQLSPDPMTWATIPAPEPRDVCWPNLAVDPVRQMSIRKFVVTGLVIVLIFFYLVPVTFVQGLAELRNLQKWLPVGGIVNIPIVGSFIAGFLPVLILSSAIYVLPGILYYLSYLEGFHSYSKIERAASGKLIFFYVVNTFFASVVSGSVLSELDRFLDAPKLIPERLAVAIPGKATFFITYIMFAGWTGFTYELLRVGPLIFFHGLRLVVEKKDEELIDLVSYRSIQYHRVIPEMVFFILVGLVYAIIAPIIVPFLIVYFVMAYGVYRNQISNVYMPTYESGGQFWPQLHNRVIAVLILMQITVMGVLGTKQAVRAAPSMIPLPFLTLYFNKFCTDRFLSCFKKTSLESATAWDVMNHGNHLASNGDLDLQFCADAYQHPAMKPIMSYGERENEAEQPPSPSPVSREDNDNYYPPRNE